MKRDNTLLRVGIEHTTVRDQVLAHAREQPGRLFAKIIQRRGSPQTITYGELLANAARYAAMYQRRQVKAGEVVILILEQGPELLHAFVGAMLYGAVPSIFAFPSSKIPADVYDHTLDEMLTVCGTPYLVTSPELEARLGPTVKARMTLMRPGDAATESPKIAPWPDVSPDAVVLLQHSSGTTGLKKGVALTNRAMLEQLRHLSDALALTPTDSIVSWLPLYHDMGLIACLMLPVVAGVPVVMMSPFDWIADPAMLLRTITEERSTLCWLPNFAYQLMATRLPDKMLAGINLSSMRSFINCAEPVRAESHAVFRERFVPYGLRPESLGASYAMAENTFAITQGGIHEPLSEVRVDWGVFSREHRVVQADAAATTVRTLVSSGRLLENNEVRIVDDERRDLAESHVGEIAIRSDSLMVGYFHRPEVTAAVMADGWYFSGDLGFVLNGHLFVTGRKKDMIIVAGKNIYPQDVEAIVSEVPGVYPGRVVALGVTNETKGTEDIVVLAETQIDGAELASLRLRIAEALRYRLECVVDDLQLVPHMWLLKSSSGKIARNANRDKYLTELRRS